MKTQSVTDLIQERRDSLSTTEQKIADYILKNTSQVVHFTVKDLAGASDVSEATVIRMCQHIGFSGFWPLRTALTAEVALNHDLVLIDIIADGVNLILGEVLNARIHVNVALDADLRRSGAADAVNVGQTDLNALLTREVDTINTGQRSLLS